ncbi:ribonuclease E/G [Sphingomonas hengshuiensis]|uniref:Ribonuclease n=1 Tax=Sphingomonas hengshuiensis TaxID=1609977 RepID=A0A7U5BED9_9SPHN|nr:ribonuclease E/G [Sphingomonas hengshuiensis]AJP70715.1 ribonuclease [Sphingomonas hengshuiensis]
MAEWLYEAGIGENRAALVSRGTIWKARIELEGTGARVGAILNARLADRSTGKVTLDGGGEALCDPLPPGVTQGGPLRVRIVREAIPEPGRPKLPKAVPSDALPMPGLTLLERITASDVPVRVCRAHEPDLLEQAGWSEVLDEAVTGEIAFPGGALRLSPTPAMTLFDVDGGGPLEPLAVAAAHAVARAIERHGITGSIGVDFPTLANRAARAAVAEAIDAALPQPFERTTVNGFGFLQIVRRRTRPSLPELLRADPIGAETRAELRRIERLPPPPPATHMTTQRIARRLAQQPGWTTELARRSGGTTQFVSAKE